MRNLAVHHRCCGTTLEGGTDEIMAVVIGAAQRNEQVSRDEGACIDRYACRRPIRDIGAACRRNSVLGGPERRHQRICQARAYGHNGATSRTTATSSNGCVLPPMIWPVS